MTDADKPTYDELAGRIADAAAHHGGHLPAADAAAWAGYIAALLEWDLLTPHDHGRLQDRLPPSAAAAVLPIFLGPDGAAAVAATPPAGRTRVAS